jgi:ABC-2 type transport system permease protein
MLLVARRDLAGYLNSYWGYAVIAVVLLLDGLFFNAFAVGDQPKYSSKVIEDFFMWSFGMTNAAAILLTMRLVAEEKQTGTMMLIDSSPLAPWQYVGGKYISGLTMVLVMILLTLHMPALVFINGKVSYGHLFAGYLGLALAGAAIAAIGTFTSTVARSQLVAGFLSAALTVFFLLMYMVAKIADPPLKDIFAYSSSFDRHFRSFQTGKIATEDVVFYLSVVFVFLMLASRYLAARRWR